MAGDERQPHMARCSRTVGTGGEEKMRLCTSGRRDSVGQAG